VFFMGNKSEAGERIKQFVAQLNAYLSAGKATPIRAVGYVHTDNAGEFLSRDMQAFLASETIHQTTCPPYVHALNGVTERAIRSIFECARTAISASGSPKGFWTYTVTHAVDYLNRTSASKRGAFS